MIRLRLATLFSLGLLGGCTALASAFDTTAAAGETPGQLFCQISQSTGVSTIVSVIDADVPGAVLVTGIAAAVVADDCAKAAASVKAVAGIPVSPPPVPSAVGSVAIHLTPVEVVTAPPA
jgi:hypothetical protein